MLARLWYRLRLLWLMAAFGLNTAMSAEPEEPLWGETPAAPKKAPTVEIPPELENYTAMGHSVADSLQLAELDWTPEQLEAFIVGIRASQSGQFHPHTEKNAAFLDAINRRITELQRQRREEQKNVMYKDLRESFGLQQTESGLSYRLVSAGNGPRPRLEDTIVVSLSARELDGATDVSTLKAEGLKTRVRDLLPGLREGVQLLTLGSRAVFMLPPDLSFGNGAWPAGVKRGTPILFMVQLVDVIPAKQGPPTP